MKKIFKNKRDLPFGIRNNNPGNLIWTAEKWLGLDNPSHVVNETSGRPFFRFATPVFGIRAIVRVLLTYHDKRMATSRNGGETNVSPIDTIEEVCARWDEPTKEQYIKFLCQYTGYGAKQEIDFHDYDVMKKLVCGIIRMENGCMPYNEKQIDAGLARAGIAMPEEAPPKLDDEFKRKPAKKPASRTLRGSLAAGIGTVGLYLHDLGIQGMEQVKNIMSILPFSPRNIFVAIAIAAIGVIIYARVDDKKKGLR